MIGFSYFFDSAKLINLLDQINKKQNYIVLAAY